MTHLPKFNGYQPEEVAIRPDAYSGGFYFKIHMGDIYHERYIVVEKLGLGGKFISFPRVLRPQWLHQFTIPLVVKLN